MNEDDLNNMMPEQQQAQQGSILDSIQPNQDPNQPQNDLSGGQQSMQQNPELEATIADSLKNIDFSALDQKPTKKKDITDLDKMNVDNLDQEDEDELMETFTNNFSRACSYWEDQKNDGAIDVDFYIGNQWDALEVSARDEDGLLTTCANKIATPINKILADFQKNTPKVSFKKGYSSKKEAEVAIMNTIVDKIQSSDFCLKSYFNAMKNATITGEGYLRAYIDYESSVSLRKEIKISSIENNNCVYVDPDYKTNFEYNYCVVVSKISKDEYRRRFKNKMQDDYDIPSRGFAKIEVDTTCETLIAEYFYIEEEEDEVYKLDNGLYIRKKDYDNLKGKKSAINTKGSRVFKKVKHMITDFEKVLELKTFPGEIIPIFPCFVNETMVNNKKILNGAVRRAIEPQRDYNYFRSTLLDIIDKMPRLTWMSGEGQLTSKTKRMLMEGNRKNGLIEYKTEDSTGTPIGKPERIDTSVNIDSVLTSMQVAEQDIQNAIGIFDTTLGNDGNTQEESGIAKITKAQQSEENNFYIGNAFSQTLRLVGKFLMFTIPLVYNDDRKYSIKTKAGTESREASPQDVDIDFLDVDYDIDVSISGFGKNERQVEFDNLLGLVSISPEILPMIADLIVQTSGLTNSEEISERLIAGGFVNPAALTASTDEKYSAIAALQQQLQQTQATMVEMQTQNEQLVQQLDLDKQNYSTLVNELNDAKAQVLTLQTKQAQNVNDNVVKLIMKMSEQNPAYTRFALQYLGVNIPMIENTQPLTPQEIPQQYTLASVNDPITQMQNAEQQQGNNVIGQEQQQVDENGNPVQQEDEEAGYQRLLAMMPNLGKSV